MVNVLAYASLKIQAFQDRHENNHAVPIRKKRAEFSQLHVLSFSASRYAASTLGEIIRRARLKKGLKQIELAEAVGVTEMTVVSWERRTDWPRVRDKILRACETLGLMPPERG